MRGTSSDDHLPFSLGRIILSPGKSRGRPPRRRIATVVPPQALFLMNSPMSVDVARRLVNRPEFAAARDDLAKVSTLYRIIFQRMPTKKVYEMGLRFVAA